jgi:hypothetical protein
MAKRGIASGKLKGTKDISSQSRGKPMAKRGIASGKLKGTKDLIGKCKCGHSGGQDCTAHGPRYQAGHGECKLTGCHCKQFTWVSWMNEP